MLKPFDKGPLIVGSLERIKRSCIFVKRKGLIIFKRCLKFFLSDRVGQEGLNGTLGKVASKLPRINNAIVQDKVDKASNPNTPTL